DDLLGEGARAPAVLLRPRDVEPLSSGQLALPRESELPVRVVGRAPDTGVFAELAHEVVREPRAQLVADRGVLGPQRDVHVLRLSSRPRNARATRSSEPCRWRSARVPPRSRRDAAPYNWPRARVRPRARPRVQCR